MEVPWGANLVGMSVFPLDVLSFLLAYPTKKNIIVI